MGENDRQLPRGRHGLSRDEVQASQRTRMAAAVLDAVAEHGYAGATVAHIVRGARVSRETFYEHHASKDDCYALAVGAAGEALVGDALTAMRDVSEPVAAIDAFLRVYLGRLAEEPAATRCLVLELDSPGRPALEEEPGSISRLGAEIDAACPVLGRFAADFFVAGMQGLVAREVRAGRLALLADLREPLLHLVRGCVEAQAAAAA